MENSRPCSYKKNKTAGRTGNGSEIIHFPADALAACIMKDVKERAASFPEVQADADDLYERLLALYAQISQFERGGFEPGEDSETKRNMTALLWQLEELCDSGRSEQRKAAYPDPYCTQSDYTGWITIEYGSAQKKHMVTVPETLKESVIKNSHFTDISEIRPASGEEADRAVQSFPAQWK